MMRYVVLLMLSGSLIVLAVGAHAQGRLEVSYGVGSQTYLNDMEPDPGSAVARTVGIAWQLTGAHSVWARCAWAAYEVRYFSGSTMDETVANILAGYRYTFRHEEMLRPYLEIGVGASDPIIGYDTGAKSAGSAALGVQWLRWKEGKTGVYVEYHSVAWDQDNAADVAELLLGVRGEDTSVQSAEFTIGIVGRFL